MHEYSKRKRLKCSDKILFTDKVTVHADTFLTNDTVCLDLKCITCCYPVAAQTANPLTKLAHE